MECMMQVSDWLVVRRKSVQSISSERLMLYAMFSNLFMCVYTYFSYDLVNSNSQKIYRYSICFIVYSFKLMPFSWYGSTLSLSFPFPSLCLSLSKYLVVEVCLYVCCVHKYQCLLSCFASRLHTISLLVCGIAFLSAHFDSHERFLLVCHIDCSFCVCCVHCKTRLLK